MEPVPPSAHNTASSTHRSSPTTPHSPTKTMPTTICCSSKSIWSNKWLGADQQYHYHSFENCNHSTLINGGTWSWPSVEDWSSKASLWWASTWHSCICSRSYRRASCHSTMQWPSLTTGCLPWAPPPSLYPSLHRRPIRPSPPKTHTEGNLNRSSSKLYEQEQVS